MLSFPLPNIDPFARPAVRPALAPRGPGPAILGSLGRYAADMREQAARRGPAWAAYRAYVDPLELLPACFSDRRGEMPRAYFVLAEIAAEFGIAAPSLAPIRVLSFSGRLGVGALGDRRGLRGDDAYGDVPASMALSAENLKSLYFQHAASMDVVCVAPEAAPGGAPPGLSCGSARETWARIAFALCLQRAGGALVLRTDDVLTQFAVDVLALLASCYASVHMAKPQACDCTCGDVYVVCRGFSPPDSLYADLRASLLAVEAAPALCLAGVLAAPPPLHFAARLSVCAAVIGKARLEAMHATLLLIDGGARQFKLCALADANARRCAEWQKRVCGP